MARRLSIWLSPEQARMLHDEALRMRERAADETLRQRWDAIVRKTADSLAWIDEERDESGEQGKKRLA